MKALEINITTNGVLAIRVNRFKREDKFIPGFKLCVKDKDRESTKQQLLKEVAEAYDKSFA